MARKSATAEAGNGDKVAKLLNISIPQVYNLANSGIIPKSDNGVWDLAACAHGYIKYLQGRSGDEKRDLASERTRLLRLQGDRVELETAILRAELIPAEVVKSVWTGILGAVRSRLLAIPSRLAVTCFGAADQVELEDGAMRLVEEALHELADFDGTLYRTARARAAHLPRVGGDSETAAAADGESVGEPQPAPQRRRQRRAGSVPA